MTNSGGTASEHRWRVTGLVSLVLISVLMLATVWDYGMIWDEEFHQTYGEYVVAWFTSGFQDDRAFTYKNSYSYGGLFDVLAQLFAWVSPFGLYEDRHLVNLGFGILALAGTRRLGTLLLGPRGGVLSMGLTALTPMFYGHSFNNPKDIPFAALFVWALCYLYESTRSLPGTSKSAAVKLSICLGAMLATRPGGIFFIVYIAAWWLVALWRARAPKRNALRAAVAFGWVIAGAWVIMLSCWPWGQVSPIFNPLRGIVVASRFSFALTTLFLGEQVPARNPPMDYLPIWFGAQLPEFYFVAGAAALAGYVCRRRRQNNDAESDLAARTSGDGRTERIEGRNSRMNLRFLGFVILFPIVTAVVLRSTLYDGVRHFLFLIPPLAVVAAAGIESGLRTHVPRAVRTLIVGAGMMAAAITVWDMIMLHPYQSIYFNRVFAGGLPGANGRLETDYWGNSYREAIEWVMANVQGQGIRIANCSNALQSSYYLRGPEGARFIHVAMTDKPDLLLATTRWDCHLRTPGRALHTVRRQGVPLAHVLDLRP